MSNTRNASRRKRGQLLAIRDVHEPAATPPTPTLRRSRTTMPPRVVLLPRWQPIDANISTLRAVHDAHPAHPSVDGALALLEAPTAEPTSAPHRMPARRQILVVEDDARVASVIRECLELENEADWHVQTAREGLRALEIASATPPDVVLLDVRLPDVDGAEVYRRLRASQKTRRARVLFLSASTTLDLHQHGIDEGMLLRKPFDVRELVRIVRALLDA